MLSGSRVLVVVPAFEEAPRIRRVIRTMPPMVDTILVVDDASKDGTASAALAEGDPRVTVLRHGANRGVGAAIVTGYREALKRGGGPRDAFVVMAGDGQMDPRDLPALVGPVARGDAGYAKGDRFGDPAIDHVMARGRYLGGKVFSAATSLAIGRPIRDSQCGYTAMARAACEALDLDAVWTGYGYPNDVLGKLACRGIAIAEVPVRPIYADEISRLRVAHLPRIAFIVARAWGERVRARRLSRLARPRATAAP